MKTKSPFESREVVGRRNRPAKEPLSREAIVKAALELLTQEGLEGMSLRKVAARLNTGPASLYVYVENLQTLQALVLDLALADVELPKNKRGTWRERFDALMHSYHAVLFGRPGLAQLAMSTVSMGPNALGIYEALLGLFDEAGVPPKVAAWAMDLVTLYATAIAAEQDNRRSLDNLSGSVTRSIETGSVARAIQAAPPEHYPRIHALGVALLSGMGPARFTWALEVLLNGILRTPLPPH